MTIEGLALTIEERISELGFVLPVAAKPAFEYVPVTLHNNIAYVSGQLPKVDGEVGIIGKVDAEVSIEQAQQAAQICVLQGLACLKQALGDLEHIEQILKITGFVASSNNFNLQPKVLDAASKLVYAIFGDRGKHARSAVGVAELPRNSAVEIEFIVSFFKMMI